MERKPKFCKEVKVKACKDYENGNSLREIANEIGANAENVRQWYLKYKKYGLSAIETLSKNRSYNKIFMMSEIEEYNKVNIRL